MSHYRFIQTEQASYPTTLLCRVVGVARSGFYAWLRRDVSARQQADGVLTTQITSIHQQSRATYGSPRVHAALRASDVRCSRKRVARLMRQAGLAGCRARRRTRTTRSDPAHVPAPNLVERRFTVVQPDRLWVADITYVPTWEGWLYLAVVVDACSRRVVGWAMADHLRGDLTRDALSMALERRRPGSGLVHHTDRGSQYTAGGYQMLLVTHGITASMSRAGNCYDNALAESCFATLKTELIDRQAWPTRRAVRQALFEWIEGFYNRQRLHSGLGYRSPVHFEEDMAAVRLVA